MTSPWQIRAQRLGARLQGLGRALEQPGRLPGGVLRLSVPDFALLSRAYLEGVPLREIQRLVLGGQDYRLNFHSAPFDEAALRDLMSAAGLVEITHWDPATVDLLRTMFVPQYGPLAFLSPSPAT